MAIEIRELRTEEDVKFYLKKIDTLTQAEAFEQAEQVRKALEDKIEITRQERFRYLIPAKETGEQLSRLISCNEHMVFIKNMVRKLACEKDAILIVGESGTGKDILAQALHGGRRGKFVPFNCAAMPQELIESELFGHNAGAFTGASGIKIGLFEHAKDGTLFLDEIGDLPLLAQAKLLRVLQDKKVRRVGSNEETQVNVRIVCATHHNLEEMVEAKLFRRDLFSRINTFPLVTLPIRNRREDIELIVRSLSPAHATKIISILKENHPEYIYPANVRDLQRFCRQVEVLGKII